MNIKTLFTYFPMLVGLVTFFAFILPCRLRVRAQAISMMVILFATSKFFAFEQFGGDAFNPILPAAVIWGWDVLYSTVFVLFAFAAPAFILHLCFRFDFRRLLYPLPLASLAIVIYGTAAGIIAPGVDRIELAFDDLPAELDGFTIAQLTDTHISSAARRWRTERIVETTNALHPDLICFTGDFLDGEIRQLRRDVEPLRRLESRLGVYACTGNHEYYWPFDEWRPLLERWGVRFLSNECVKFGPLALAGVDDPAGYEYPHRRCRVDTKIADVRGAFATATNGEFRVLMEHRPGHARENTAEAGVRLQLSGHTHGGIAPFFAPLIAGFNNGFVRGLYPLANGAYLYLSPGAGQWAGFPMRLFNPSEITLITLRRSLSDPGRTPPGQPQNTARKSPKE